MTPPVNLKRERKYWQEKLVVAGVDEAGRGPLAGPVVAAAVILPSDFKLPGLDDSKKLTAEKREALFKIISERSISVGVGIVDNFEIDRINILQASLLAMRLAVQELSIAPSQILVDGRFIIPNLNIKQQAIIGGDGKSESIAAASVIAKVTRDRIMLTIHDRFPQYGFDRHKGYGTKDHFAAIKKYGLTNLHRKSFNSSKK
jgi:ribonuclease HII